MMMGSWSIGNMLSSQSGSTSPRHNREVVGWEKDSKTWVVISRCPKLPETLEHNNKGLKSGKPPKTMASDSESRTSLIQRMTSHYKIGMKALDCWVLDHYSLNLSRWPMCCSSLFQSFGKTTVRKLGSKTLWRRLSKRCMMSKCQPQQWSN